MTTVYARPEYDIGSDVSRLVNRIRRVVVEIRSPAGGGAGIVWGGTGLVVTNAHCVRKNSSVAIQVNGESRAVESIAFADDHDLALIHAPSVDGPSIELRDIDMRDLYFKANVIGTPPKGKTINIMLARFETVPETKERLEITAVPSGNDTLITVHYGNRKTTVTLTGI